MAWTGNPEINPLLQDALAIDVRIKAAEEAANPGPLEPTQAIVENGDTFSFADGIVNMAVAANAASATVAITATKAVVTNGQSIPTADGGTVVLTVAGNAITAATYTAGG